MSFFGKFATFFEHVGSELEKLFGASSLEQKAQSVILYVSPLALSILALVDPAAVPVATTIINRVKSGLATVSAVVQGGTVAPGTPAGATISTALASINTNLADLLATAEIKNSAKINEITAVVTGITGEVNALLAGFGVK